MSATPQRTTSYEGKSIMAAKKKPSTTADAGLQTLKIGSRVRCADDHVEGRTVWASGVSMKIRWDDGEQVTWRRDSLADRPIEIIGDDENQATTPATTAEQSDPPQAEQETEAQAPDATTVEPNAPTPEHEAATAPPGAADPMEGSADPEAATAPPPASEPAAAPTASAPEQTVAKTKRQRKALAETQEKKLSALDAAAKVLAETHTPMNCQELIDAMAGKGYWTSPGGKTPAATLYSALLREVTTKGDQARFTKAKRGKFDLAKRD
jgi:HB1, ASXL, restriction endonuclease HTH domain